MGMRLLRLLLLFHGIAMLAAGAVLLIWPGAIPSTAGIDLKPEAYLLCYLLAGSELALAFLSFGAMRIMDPIALRMVCWTMIVLHLSTAGGELLVLAHRPSPVLWANVALRAAVSILFVYFGLMKNPPQR